MKTRALLITALWFVVVAGIFMVTTEQDAVTTAGSSDDAASEQEDESSVRSTYGAMGSGKRMFSHQFHVEVTGLKCISCHPSVFERRMGAAKANGDYNMASINAGRYCGDCHNGDTAFETTGPETCKKCHGSDMKQPEIVVFNRPVKGVVINHRDHVDLGLDCASCHDNHFEMRKGAAEEDYKMFNMRALYSGQYCGVCHNGNIAFAANTRCTSCHIGVKGVERMVKKAAADEKKEE